MHEYKRVHELLDHNGLVSTTSGTPPLAHVQKSKEEKNKKSKQTSVVLQECDFDDSGKLLPRVRSVHGDKTNSRLNAIPQ